MSLEIVKILIDAWNKMTGTDEEATKAKPATKKDIAVLAKLVNNIN